MPLRLPRKLTYWQTATGQENSRGYLSQRLERRAQIGHEKLRLLPGREVGALVVLVEEDEFGISLLSPTLWRLVDLFGESAHGDRDLDAPHIEEATAGRKSMPGVPVQACRGDGGVRQPV